MLYTELAAVVLPVNSLRVVCVPLGLSVEVLSKYSLLLLGLPSHWVNGVHHFMTCLDLGAWLECLHVVLPWGYNGLLRVLRAHVIVLGALGGSNPVLRVLLLIEASRVLRLHPLLLIRVERYLNSTVWVA